MVKRPRRATKLFPETAAATPEPEDDLLVDALHLDTIAVRDAGATMLEITIGGFAPAPFAAKVLVLKSLDEESLRAFLRRLSDKEEDILAYVAASKSRLR